MMVRPPTAYGLSADLLIDRSFLPQTEQNCRFRLMQVFAVNSGKFVSVLNFYFWKNILDEKGAEYWFSVFHKGTQT